MKNKANRLNVQTLYVLGAGASYGATVGMRSPTSTTAPLDREFCQRILDMEVARPLWVSKSRDFINAQWTDHVPLRDVGLEGAIIRQLSHLRFFEGIYRRRRAPCTPYEYLNHLSHLICYMLRGARERGDELYKALANHAFPGTATLEDYRSRIVTFNYDDLLDQHLLRRFSAQKVYFDRIRSARENRARRGERFNHPLLVKLHGSVNWRIPSTEFQRIVDDAATKDARGGESPYWIDDIWVDLTRSPSPDDDEAPAIVPPIPNKPITRISLFGFLWTKAYEYLHAARELVLIGYSLPDTDPLAGSMFSHFKNKELERVVVVDPNPAIMAKWRTLLARSAVRTPKWEYCADFREYLESITSLSQRYSRAS